MKAQGFDRAPLDLLKAHFNPDQPRWQAGSGRDSGGAGNGREIGESTSDDANITPVAFYRGHGRGRDSIGSTVSSNCPENRAKGLLRSRNFNPKPSDFVGQDFGKLGAARTSPNSTLANFQNTLLNG
jgi:hypothetical protein